jgi:cellulose synthase (UDP-forming)
VGVVGSIPAAPTPPQVTAALEARASLEAARAMPGEVERLLGAPADRARWDLDDFERRWGAGAGDPREEAGRLSACAAAAARWFDDLAATVPIDDHTDDVFVEQVLGGPARDLGALARRLDAVARARNKAMNLNSYIRLMGRRWREVRSADGVHLVPAKDGSGDLAVPAATYLITLDADSLLLPDYALRLVEVMERPENHRTAVIQTPYSAVPEAPGIVERIAGATTDLQYIVHQGSPPTAPRSGSEPTPSCAPPPSTTCASRRRSGGSSCAGTSRTAP